MFERYDWLRRPPHCIVPLLSSVVQMCVKLAWFQRMLLHAQFVSDCAHPRSE